MQPFAGHAPVPLTLVPRAPGLQDPEETSPAALAEAGTMWARAQASSSTKKTGSLSPAKLTCPPNQTSQPKNSKHSRHLRKKDKRQRTHFFFWPTNRIHHATMAQEDVVKTNVSPRRMSAPKRAYLVAYNAISALLWSVVLGHTLSTLLAHGLERGPALVYPAVGEWTKWTQTLAALEIVHSVLGAWAPSLPFPIPPSGTSTLTRREGELR